MNFSKFFIGLSLVSTLFIFSCNDDNEIILPILPPTPAEMLLGTWEMTELEYDAASETVVTGFPIGPFTSVDTGSAIAMTTTLVFTETPNDFTSNDGYILDLESTADGQTSNSTVQKETFAENGTWVLTNNDETIIITGPDGETQEFQVIELTDSTLKISRTYVTVESEDLATGGITATVTTTTTANEVVIFIKQ